MVLQSEVSVARLVQFLLQGHCACNLQILIAAKVVLYSVVVTTLLWKTLLPLISLQFAVLVSGQARDDQCMGY